MTSNHAYGSHHSPGREGGGGGGGEERVKMEGSDPLYEVVA